MSNTEHKVTFCLIRDGVYYLPPEARVVAFDIDVYDMMGYDKRDGIPDDAILSITIEGTITDPDVVSRLRAEGIDLAALLYVGSAYGTDATICTDTKPVPYNNTILSQGFNYGTTSAIKTSEPGYILILAEND